MEGGRSHNDGFAYLSPKKYVCDLRVRFLFDVFVQIHNNATRCIHSIQECRQAVEQGGVWQHGGCGI